MGLSDCSSVDCSKVSDVDGSNSRLNLKATELRLGLPGSLSPERDSELRLVSTQLDKKPIFPLHPVMDTLQQTTVSGNKRGFYDAMDEFSEGKSANTGVNLLPSPRPSPNLIMKTGSLPENHGTQESKMKVIASEKIILNCPQTVIETKPNPTVSSSVSANKAQVVGWPPIRSFRKNSLPSVSKNVEEVDGKPGTGALYVKVSMDGAPYLRKVDLKHYAAYQELSSALENMFSCFTIGQYGSHGALGREISERNLKDLLHGSEYVLTYEDKDGDWMLVGDVPWEMFITTCKRMRIMKSSDAIGLAPRAIEKCKSRN